MSGRTSFASAIFAASFLLGSSGCSKWKKKAAPPPAPSQTIAVATAPPPPPAAPVDAGPSTSAAALDRSRQWLADLKWMVAHKTTANPQKSGEGDAGSKCDAVIAAHASIPPDAQPEYRTNLDEAADLCAFDVPLLTAAEALDQLRFSPSQASRLLMCTVAKKEIARARAYRPRDAKVRRIESRRGNLCR